MIALWFRNALYALLVALITPWLAYRRHVQRRTGQGWREKFCGLTRSGWDESSGTGPTIWLHGVSVGEIQLLRPLVEELQARLPDARCVVSTTTSTGMQVARNAFGPSVRLFYFPLDFSWAVARTIKSLRPSLIVLGELEVWPNLLAVAKRRGVPVAVINGRLSERSFRGYRRFGWLTRRMFAQLTFVATQSETYRRRFIECGVPPERVHTSGSMKFDNVSFDRNASAVASLAHLVGLGPGLHERARVWVVGSTQALEERHACEYFLRVREEFPDLKLIVIPRHQERFGAVAAELREVMELNAGGQLKLVRRSNLDQPLSIDAWDVLLVDTLGELRWWWGLADVALVGGSFGKRGGQNMIEPAAYGINLAFGPNTSNFRDVVELLLAADAACRLESFDAIHPWLIEQLRNPQAGCQRGGNAQRLVEQQQGALLRTTNALVELIVPRRATYAAREVA